MTAHARIGRAQRPVDEDDARPADDGPRKRDARPLAPVASSNAAMQSSSA